MSDLAGVTLTLPAVNAWPERPAQRAGPVERCVATLASVAIGSANDLRAKGLMRIVPAVDAYAHDLAGLDDQELRARAEVLRPTLRHNRHDRAALAQLFAIIREIAGRAIGKRHHGVQLAAGLALLRGMVAEMEPGEGKTLTATLAASAVALAGEPVHVVTVNDYLARRDAEAMGPVYRALGLSVGLAETGQTHAERQRAYRADIVYVTNKELAFDYLRDRLAGGNKGAVRDALRPLLDASAPLRRLRGLGTAIIDEADSVLIDEARTPLIIGAEAPGNIPIADLRQALADARALHPGEDFTVWPGQRRVEIGDAALDRLVSSVGGRGGRWLVPAWRKELWRQALTALHLCLRDIDYMLRDGQIEIIDEFTGRAMPGRSWCAGLQELVAIKEGLPLAALSIDRARLTYQRFFRRYRNLAGMTATANEVSRELWTVYGLRVARLPTHRPKRRLALPTLILPAGEKWPAIGAEIARMHALGQPVLLGTRTLAASVAASEALAERGLPHGLLNAAQDRGEAETLARAGEAGQITIATNMAGRGADIGLGVGVAALGGLHVIISELHEARRIDRQLAGRSARHGAPGSYRMMLGLDDALALQWPLWLRNIAGQRLMLFMMRVAQFRTEWRNARLRQQLLRVEDVLYDVLAFSGPRE
jgi:preprotein translocase subunit SecA